MSTTFPKVKRSQSGYHIEQVEDFLEEARRAYSAEVTKVTGIDSLYIRKVSFDIVKGGYSTEHVDGALDRLEDAFAKRERDRQISQIGESAFYERVQEEATQVLGRLTKPVGERFARTGPLTKGYKVSQVDEFADRLASYLNDGPELTPASVLLGSFDAQRGGYSEDDVDDLFDRVIWLMRAVR